MDARAATDVCGSSVRRSRVVLTPRCWRQAGGRYPAGDGGKRAVHRGELAISRKAIAQGRPECSRCPVCSCALLYAQIARETAGAASTRSFLRPLIGEGKVNSKTSGVLRREKAKAYAVCSPDERSDIRDRSHTAPDFASLIRATRTQLRGPAASACHAAPPAGWALSSPASRRPSAPSPRPKPRGR